jgi:hypothetical protein
MSELSVASEMVVLPRRMPERRYMKKHIGHSADTDGSLLVRELNHRINNELTCAICAVSVRAMESNEVAVKAALLDVVDYTWVRLAQRVPVRIAIDKVPPGVPLVSGLTATVTIRDGKSNESFTRLQRLRAEVETSFSGLFGGAPERPDCIPNPS